MSKTTISWIFIVLLGLAAVVNGQTSKGTISGTVTDFSGAVVNGATVTAKDKSTNEIRTATTGGNGEYRISAVNASTYEISIEKAGFAPLKLDNLVVRASVITSANAQLKVGGTNESVSVEANALGIETDSAELSKTLSQKEITDLPVGSLNPLELVLTEPGAVSVSTRDNFTQGVAFTVDGLRPRGNGFLIDGFDNNDDGIRGQAIQPQNLEAVQEVALQTNSYSAEFGGSGASVSNVIYKGGTNAWHGGLWERYAGTGFNAITAEQHASGLTTVPRQVDNTFGFQIGGPIVKDKLFIFGTSQWDRLFGGEQGSTLTIPTAAGLATLQSIPQNTNVSALIASLGGLTAPRDPASLQSISIGNRPGCNTNPCAVELANVNRQSVQQSPGYEYDIRGDYTPTTKDTFTVRFIGTHSSLTPDLFANPTALPGTDTLQGGPEKNLGSNWTHVLNSHMVNEARFTFQTFLISFAPTAATLKNPFANLPDFEVAELTNVDFGGVISGFPQFRDHQTYQYQDAFSWNVGNHSFKFGTDIVHYNLRDSIPFNSRGLEVFNPGGDCSSIGLTSCSGLANYIDDFTGQGGQATINFGNPVIKYGQNTQAYYAEDAWRLRSDLTLNLGLRYEYSGTPFNNLPFPAVNEKTALTDPVTLKVKEQPDKNNFGPRVGIAYTPHFWKRVFGEDKTVIRAGYGTFYDQIFGNITVNTAASTPNVTGGTFVDPTQSGSASRGTPNAVGLFSTLTSALNPTDAVSTSAANLRNPMSHQWNLNIQRELPGQFLATVAYVGTRGERLFLNEELNPGINGVRLNPNRGSILARTNHGDSIYHGLQADVNRRFHNGLLLRAAYTFSKSIDDGSEVFITTGLTTRVQRAFNFRGDRGPSAFDRRHRAVFTWLYDVPYPHSTEGLMRAVSYASRDWQLSGTAAFETGPPETIAIGIDQNGDLSSANDRPSLGNPNVPIDYKNCLSSSATCNSGVGFSLDGVHFTDFNSSFAPNFSATAKDFRYLVTVGSNGNISRNSFYNPGRQDWTMSVQRTFKVTEGAAFQIRLEAFNPFNHANFGGGTGLDGGTVLPVNARITSPDFMNVLATREGGRVLRAWVKFNF